MTTDARRRQELAKIHIGQKALGLDDGAYRALLVRLTGRDSASKLDAKGRAAVLDYMTAQGFKPELKKKAPRRAGRRPLATGEMQGKIRALWLSLYHLGAVEDPSEAALARFVQRQTGIEALQWLDGASADKAIKALRGWCERVGFVQPDAAAVRAIDGARERGGLEPQGPGFAAKVVLINALWARLVEADAMRHSFHANLGSWLATRFAVSAPQFLEPAQADRAIEGLGAWLRRTRQRAALRQAQGEEKPR